MHERRLRVTSSVSKTLGLKRESDRISTDYLKLNPWTFTSSLFLKKFVLGLSTAFHFHLVQLFLSVSLSAGLFVSEQNSHFFSTSILIFPMIFSVVFVYTPLGQYPVSKRFQERHWGLSKGRTLISTLLLELVKWQESPSLDPITSWFLW